MLPATVRLLPLTATSSVTEATVGVPITASSLVPVMVKLTILEVPSRLEILKLSVVVTPALSICTALLATE